jgi:SAM-dependent methyltransferase
MAFESRDWYDTPAYYDLIFDADTQKEAAFLEGVWQRFGGKGSGRRRRLRLLEAACGSGRVMGEMIRRGWNGDGFDVNEAMLANAKARLGEVEAAGERWQVWRDAMETFQVPGGRRYEVAHCLVSTFKYLPTEAAARSCLERLAGALVPGGLLVLGLHLTDYGRTKCEHERWVEARDGLQVVCNIRTWPADRKRRLERVRSRLKVTEGGRAREQETVWDFRTYDARQLRRLLRAAVPELELAGCYDFTYDLDAPRELDDRYADVIVVLRKPAV